MFAGHKIADIPVNFPIIRLVLKNGPSLEVDLKDIFRMCLNSTEYCSIIKAFSEDYIIIGSPVLTQFYVSIDTESMVIGFAELSACAQPLIFSRFSD